MNRLSKLKILTAYIYLLAWLVHNLNKRQTHPVFYDRLLKLRLKDLDNTDQSAAKSKLVNFLDFPEQVSTW